MSDFHKKRYANIPVCIEGFEAVNRYWDNRHDSFAAKLLPGEFYVTKVDEIIVTVLGSCVSACVRDPFAGVGGMNHFMLPMSGNNQLYDMSVISDATRYGNYAMEHLINEVLINGGMRKRMEIKIFGGGRVLQSMTDVGKKNIDFVLDYLHQENLSIQSQDVGDIFPRKVIYDPMSGKVLVKKLQSLHNDTILRREETYIHDLEITPVDSGEIELFD